MTERQRIKRIKPHRNARTGEEEIEELLREAIQPRTHKPNTTTSCFYYIDRRGRPRYPFASKPEPERPKKKKPRIKEKPRRPWWRTKPEEGPPW